MRTANVTLAAIFGIAALLFLSAAGPVQASHGDVSGRYGGTLRVAVQGPLNLNPFTATDADSWKVIPLVFDSLARIDPVTLRPAPWAAASWSLTGSTLTVTLRSGLAFSDGSAATATDVVYSYTQYKAAGRVPSDTAVTATSASVVTLSSATGGGLLYGYGLTLPIVKSGTGLTNAAVGGGPWKLQSSTATSWTLAANAAHFWPPFLDTVTFTQYVDRTLAATALLSGNLDFLGWSLSVDEPSKIINVGGVNKTLLANASIVQNPGLEQLVVAFNMNPANATSDSDLRLALAKTLNPILFRQIYPSTIISRSPMINEDLPWFNANVPGYQVTINAIPRSTAILTESLQLLDTGGYLDQDGDGIREAPDGSALSLTVIGIPVGEDSRQFTIEEATTDVFTRLGLRATLVSVPSAQIEARIAAGNYDVFVHRIDSALDPGFMYDWFHSAGATNWFDFSDATVNGLLTSANANVDPNRRVENVSAVQLKIMNAAFFIPVLHFNAVEATVRGAFDSWVNMPGGVNNFWTYQLLHVALAGSLTADLTLVPSSVRAGSTTIAIARVVDQNGAGVQGVTVTFWLGGTQLAGTSTTDAAGSVSRSITAPAVDGITDLDVTVQAAKLGYAGAITSSVVTVSPNIPALAVSVSSSDVTIASGEQATITVTVTAGGSAVPGATVSLDVIGLGGRVAAASGPANAQGQYTTTFTADVGPRTQFRIVATATADGYADGSNSASVIVEQRVGTVEPRITPGLDTGTIIVAILALVVIGALAALAGRKK